MESADAHQLGKTVDLLSKVHNVKQALIRIFPCLKHVFAPTLYDYIGTITKILAVDLSPCSNLTVR
jgi:hypothetical protein